MKQTTIEWFINEMIKFGGTTLDNQGTFLYKFNRDKFDELMIKTKEMEKQQIIDAFEEGYKNGEYVYGNKYYNETFNKD